MNMITMPTIEARYSIEAQMNFSMKILTALRKYWKENSDVITAGLASMSGMYIRNFTK